MIHRRITACSLSLLISLSLISNSSAAGFALQEHSVPGLGNAFAGGAASADDASTVYFNPAGMALIEKPEFAAALHFVFPEASFTNLGTTTLAAPTQGNNSVSKEDAILPNLFYVAPLNDDLAWGVGLSTPFGLATEYDPDWVGRYIARKTELKTVNLNPSLAYRVNGNFSIGGGISYMKADATLSNAVDFGLVFLNQFQNGGIPVNAQTLGIAADIQANLGGTAYDGGLILDGDGDGWGFNVGFIHEVSEAVRWGMHYRSEVAVDLSGTADFEVGALSGFLGPAFQDQGGFVDLDLPATLSVSIYGDVNDKLSLMADITHTWWSSFESLTIRYETSSPPTSVIPELWEDVNKYSIGASYRANDQLTYRVGLAYDESPVPNDGLRSPRIPDEDRTWLTLGVSYAVSKTWDIHASYLHIFVDDPMIDNSNHTAGQRLVGRIDATVDLLSFGFNKRF